MDTAPELTPDDAESSSRLPDASPDETIEDVPKGTLSRNPYAAGLQFEASGDNVGALASFEEVLASNPSNVRALVHAARAHRALREYDKALAKLYAALATGGGREEKEAYLNLGDVYRLKAQPDSAAKYLALYRGESPEPAPLEADEREPAAVDFPWGQVALALAGSAVLAAVAILIVQRSGKNRRRGKRKAKAPFSRVVREEEKQARQGRATSEEERELDQQIEDRWRELRESSHVFESGARPAGTDDTEESQMNRILDQVEGLRTALDKQDERTRIYADIVRLQNMRIEVMSEELQMLRRK